MWIRHKGIVRYECMYFKIACKNMKSKITWIDFFKHFHLNVGLFDLKSIN